MRRTAASLVVAALVMLAGCAGGIAGPNGSGAQTADGGDSGTVSFYVSDEENAISQFEHLNVTVTKVGFAQTATAGVNASASDDVETESEGGLNVSVDGNVTAGENVTVEVTHDGEAVENATVEADDADVTATTDANGTATVRVPADAEGFSVTASTDEESDLGETEAELEVEFDGESETEWVEHDVDNRTVDLTELQGANATLLGNMSVPAGDYEKVFVHVGEVEGTLESGEEVNVKLPSQKLHLNEDFTVDQSGSVDFVFDITVFEAGGSGKYILKPVASESGTDVPIERVDVESDGDGLQANFAGNVTAGENATVEVTQGGEPVENATVTVNEDVEVTTGANGTATVRVPDDAEEFEVKAQTEEGSAYGEGEAELELEFEESDSDDSDDAETDADSEVELGATLEGSLAPGENATVVVTDGEGEVVEDATVAVDGETVGETNESGELTFAVPEDASLDTEVTVTSDGETLTLDSTTAATAN